MRSRAARLTFSAGAWIALGAAATFIATSEQQLASRRASLRAFDLHAREVADAVADARAGQQAYVAEGQGVAFWMPKVAATLQETATAIDDLRASASSPAARQALLDASAALTEFSNVDKRAREYLRSGETLMAGDVVFTEGGEVGATAARQVEAARVAEHQTRDADEARLRLREAYAAGGAAAFAAIVLALLALARPAAGTSDVPVRITPTPAELAQLAPQAPSRTVERPRGSAPALRAAAELCTEFGRVKDMADLTRLLERAADMMDATGLIVWLGDAAGRDLRPVLAYGYSEQSLSKMPAVPRTADNAAAAAYRSGQLQIVMTRPGSSPGAVVAPLLAADGCVGALTAEIRDRGETSEGVQALATIFAAQLSGVLAGSTPEASASATSRAASA